jgi:hypothetical protein
MNNSGCNGIRAAHTPFNRDQSKAALYDACGQSNDIVEVDFGLRQEFDHSLSRIGFTLAKSKNSMLLSGDQIQDTRSRLAATQIEVHES